MKNKEGHISLQQMQNYLQGKLNSAEMHAVEKHLLECDFCQDAMEGLESADIDKASDAVSDLSERINKEILVSQKEQKPRFRYSWIAAVISLVLVGSYFMLFEIIPPADTTSEVKIAQEDILGDNENLAQTEESPIKPVPDETEQDELSGSSVQRTKESPPLQDVAENQETSNEPVSDIPLQESFSALNNSKIKEEIVRENPIVQSFPEHSSEGVSAFSQEDALLSKRDEFINESESIAASMPNKRAALSTAPTEELNKIVIGKVVNAENQSPIPGVSIIRNNESGVVSDQEGNFQLPVDEDLDKITFSTIGYKTEQRSLKGKDSLIVEMQPDLEALQETVVIGYGKTSKKSQAQPVNGMNQFKQYLREELAYPPKARENQIEGNVILSFDILANGELDNIQVVEGLGYGCDEEAIRLLKEGPQWEPAQKDGQFIDQRRNLKISFKLP